MSKTYFLQILFFSFALLHFDLMAQNLIINGDFESGGPGNGFIVDGAGYNYITPPYAGTTNAGDFAVDTNPILINSIFISGGDNTTGTGNMLMIDGNSVGGQQRFYKAGDTGGGICGLTVGQTYTFRYFVKSISPTVTDIATQANIGVQFNNTSSVLLISGNTIAPLPAAGWQEVVYQFVPSNACVNIEMFNNNTSFVGNDFAIDDIAVFPPYQPVELTYSISSLDCQNNANFLALYAFKGQSPFTFQITGPVTQTNNTGYFENLPDGIYNISVTDNQNNTASSSNIVVSSQAQGVFLTNDTTICASEPVLLEASSGNGVYNWTSEPIDNNIQFINDSTATVTPTVSTTYSITGSSNNLIYNGSFQFGQNGFFSEYTLINTVANPSGQQGVAGVTSNPSFFFNPFASCSDQDGTNSMLVADGATAGAPFWKLWEQAVPVEPNTDYTFTYWATSIASQNPAQLQTRINNTVINTTGISAVLCNWQQITMTWNSGPSTLAVINLRTILNMSAGNDFAIDNISFVRAIACSSDVTVTIASDLPISVPPTVDACIGGSINISPNNGSNLQWTAPNGNVINSNNLVINNVTPNDIGTYTVSSTVPNSCFTSAQTIVNLVPGATPNATSNSISCFGITDGSASVNPTGNGPFSYLWSNGLTSNEIDNLAAGAYTVVVSDINNCLSEATVNVIEPPQIIVALQITEPDCNENNGSVTAVITGGSPNYNVTWSSGQNGTTANNLGSGTYSVTISDANNCQTSENFTLSTSNGPQVQIAHTENLLCFGDSNGAIDLTVTGGVPGYTYTWQPNVSNSNSASGLNAGNYNITVTDADNCIQNFQVVINQPNELVINPIVSNPTCGLQNGSISTNVTGGTGAYNYLWSPSNNTSNQITNLTAGIYGLTITDENNCSVSGNYTLITIGIIPLSLPNSIVIEPGSSATLNAQVGGGITNYDVQWTPTETLTCEDCLNPTAFPDNETTYTITVTTDDGCIATASIIVFVEKPCNGIALPTIFSPNEDNLHDELCVLEPQCVDALELTIFNRWGELVFRTNNPNECWDGTFRGQPAMGGVYAYQLSATSGDLIEIKSGTITLVR